MLLWLPFIDSICCVISDKPHKDGCSCQLGPKWLFQIWLAYWFFSQVKVEKSLILYLSLYLQCSMEHFSNREPMFSHFGYTKEEIHCLFACLFICLVWRRDEEDGGRRSLNVGQEQAEEFQLLGSPSDSILHSGLRKLGCSGKMSHLGCASFMLELTNVKLPLFQCK